MKRSLETKSGATPRRTYEENGWGFVGLSNRQGTFEGTKRGAKKTGVTEGIITFCREREGEGGRVKN